MIDLEKRMSKQRLHELRHPERRRARCAVREAVRSGRIPRASALNCVDCGGPAEEYDHNKGYAPENRLTVEPVCVPCHGIRGRKAVCLYGHTQTEENTRFPSEWLEEQLPDLRQASGSGERCGPFR